ncbi:ATP-binding cassette domain-containing protein [Kiritimatiellota bacterium B12222]|nr:ATP-binding cassette domain-containing protein [Kiritimatiellota bacterium B12222]
MNTQPELLSLENLEVTFQRRRSDIVRAVKGISLTIAPGETLGLVGESGCGKTTLSRAILGLVPYRGSIRCKGEELDWKKQGKVLRQQMQLIFQDPYASLNPRFTVEQALEEPLKVHTALDRQARKQRVRESVSRVELPLHALGKYPHEFSGGQRQRVAIARALMLKPEFVIADEPVSALDISVQAHILNLLLDLKNEMNLTMLFISHDLSVVRHVADRVAVMQGGEIVEEGNCEQIMESPQHVYTRKLIDAVPRLDVALGKRS